MNENHRQFSKQYHTKILKLKQQVHERFQISSLIILPKIINTNYGYLNYIWMICFILSSSSCSLFIFRNISAYMSNNIITKTIVKNQVNVGLSFPIVGICNLNIFTTEYSKYFLKQLFQTEYPQQDQYFEALIYASYVNGLNYNFDRRFFGQNLKEFLIDCQFANSKCNFEQDFEYYYDVNYGNCYRYNSGRNMKGQKVDQKYVYTKGIYNSLDLEFYIGPAENNLNPFSFEHGLILFINNESLDSNYYEGINISPGKLTRILISSYSNKRQPKPYSECTNDLNSIDSYDSLTYKKTIKAFPNLKYHYISCFIMCYQKYLGIKCNCQSTYYSVYYFESMRKCAVDAMNKTSIMIDRNCDDNLWILFSKNDEMINECDCPIECEYAGFKYVMTSSEYPTRDYAKRLLIENDLIKSKLSNSSYYQIKSSLAKVKIYYDEMIHTDISEY